jgi:hypothetical protein
VGLKLARTWVDADSTFEIIRILRAEWLPEEAEAPEAHVPVLDDLQDWLMGDWFLQNQDLLDLVSSFAPG